MNDIPIHLSKEKSPFLNDLRRFIHSSGLTYKMEKPIFTG